MSRSIATVTLNPSIDKSCRVAHVMPEHKLRCSEPRRDPGGGGINVARVVTRLGGEVTAHWGCGGAMGGILRELLEAEGVRQEPLPVAAMNRENLIVTEEISGQQYRFGMPDGPLEEDELDDWRQQVAGLSPPPAYLVLSGSLPPGAPSSFYADLTRAAPAGVKVVVDASGEGLREALSACPFLVKPNLRELQQIAGRELSGDDEMEGAAREVIANGCAEAVVVSLGRAGAFLVTAEGAEHVRAPSVRIASKVGAGDSMVGGLVHRLAAGDDLFKAVRFAVAAGAAAVLTEGTELCRREDVERVYARMRAD